jgi:hypothetical protein
MARKSGRVGCLKIQTDGVAGSAGWNIVQTKRDLSFNDTSEEVELSGMEQYDSFESGPAQFVIEGEIVKDPADAEWEALRAAKAAGSTIGAWGLDIDGGEGMRFDAKVVRFDDSANRRDGQMTSIRLVVAANGSQPAWTEDT